VYNCTLKDLTGCPTATLRNPQTLNKYTAHMSKQAKKYVYFVTIDFIPDLYHSNKKSRGKNTIPTDLLNKAVIPPIIEITDQTIRV
tara:strand:- start:16 stop:273 length:258 start_codon:yes stop_codon:yes gene_type:complete